MFRKKLLNVLLGTGVWKVPDEKSAWFCNIFLLFILFKLPGEVSLDFFVFSIPQALTSRSIHPENLDVTPPWKHRRYCFRWLSLIFSSKTMLLSSILKHVLWDLLTTFIPLNFTQNNTQVKSIEKPKKILNTYVVFIFLQGLFHFLFGAQVHINVTWNTHKATLLFLLYMTKFYIRRHLQCIYVCGLLPHVHQHKQPKH